MSYEYLQVDIAEHVALVTMNNPPVNAQNRPFRDELTAIFDELSDREDVRAIILTGAGKVFSAGADIKERQGIKVGAGFYRQHNRVTRESFYAILECDKPVIGALNGAALGAGLALAACCDILIASENAVLGMPEIDVGLMGGAKYVNMLFPRSKARRMLLTGKRVGGAEMYRMGVVEDCVAPDKLIDAAKEIAYEIAAKSPLAIRVTKQALNTTDNLGLRDGYRYEQELTVAMSKTEDAEEAQAAFVEKRPPVFKGR
ncbi:MAG: enoyl-CoA hydratase/isomerase family protein [Rhodospirillaceae bacterium]|jgi:enoyl-CoA hydratase|nr:enoyl-CoA hydratase/isomerase family protein [Rhodospirillaceae bacterium]MBT3495126.1 enoyl-CoA hydratase/isomerase family protein [Rhodospirillaceae bacterium]MBT3782552.1 enoyl-CoA hydratase/isomerase family protein [Rhodospirillaceae bacterium]MBT3977184.1 enoyl-CoA hydratase/isomerase family protein [Rhodospirillaceae bacterium]MBT4168318.1 enoyl-CoA hydratase/isomerase family protein [Rhodospirillaceae bacterium]